MAWEDSYYFGMCKAVCKAAKSSDKGDTVQIRAKSDGKTFSGVLNQANGECSFLLPPRESYSINQIKTYEEDGETKTEIVWSGEFTCDYGSYKEISVGYDVNDWQGIKDMVDDNHTTDTYQIGQQFSAKINGKDVAFDIVHMNYNQLAFGSNIIFQMHDGLDEIRRMHSTKSNSGGFGGSELCDWLNDEFYDSLPSELKSVIATYTWTGSAGGSTPKSETAKIFLPTERNIGLSGKSLQAEYDASFIFDYYLLNTSARQKKSQAGAAVNWWLCSPLKANSQQYLYVKTTGVETNAYATNKYAVCPCFMIAAGVSE